MEELMTSTTNAEDNIWRRPVSPIWLLWVLVPVIIIAGPALISGDSSQVRHLLGVFTVRFVPALAFTAVATLALAGVGFVLLKRASEPAQPSARAIIVAGALLVSGAIAIFTTI
jgi:hypothetical protein